MNQLLDSKTFFKRRVSVELIQSGKQSWRVKTYETLSGDTISNFRSDRKESAQSFYDAQKELS